MNKLRLILLILVIIIKPSILISQGKITTKSKKAITAYNNGIRSYSLNNYADAEKHFLTAIQEDTGFIENVGSITKGKMRKRTGSLKANHASANTTKRKGHMIYIFSDINIIVFSLLIGHSQRSQDSAESSYVN